MKRLLTLLFLICTISSISSQTVNFNKYKYLIVDSKFDFVRQVDGYKTSSFTKFLFKKKGFVTYLDNEEYDDELAQNGCKALYAQVKDESGFLVTKSFIEIRDCKSNLLYRSSEGRSKLKSYAKAYRQSIRQAFESIIAIPYEYDPSLSETKEVAEKKVVEKKAEKKPKVEKTPKEVKKEPVRVVQTAEVKNTFVKKEEPKPATVTKEESADLLYAQPNETGYQLVNTKPAIVFVLLKTNDPNKFFIKDRNGTFTKKGDHWLAEYYDNGKLVTKQYQVKF